MNAASLLPVTVLVIASMILGCSEELPPCDPTAAREVVFLDSDVAASGDDGLPMYAGQALLHRSCGGGGYCHSEAAAGAFRFGVPKGLDFELGIPCVDDLCEDEQSRLRRMAEHLRTVRRDASTIYAAVASGTMPPGEAGERVVDRFPTIRRVSESGVLEEGSVVPDLGSTEGRRIFGNWLSCGAPVVVTSRRAMDGESAGDVCEGSESTEALGACVVRMEVPDPAPNATFDEIHVEVLEPLCGSTCHGASRPRAATPRFGDADETYDALLRTDVDQVLVEPGSARGSHLLYHLLDAPFEERMPLGIVRARLPESVVAAIRTWIEAGAPR